MRFFQGNQERLRNSRGKRGLLYFYSVVYVDGLCLNSIGPIIIKLKLKLLPCLLQFLNFRKMIKVMNFLSYTIGKTHT